MPSLPPLSLAICELMPITRARAVEQRPAGVALVDRGVGLDDVLDLEVVGRGDDALERRHDPRGRGALEAEGVADRDHRVADRQAGAAARAAAAARRGARPPRAARRGRCSRPGPAPRPGSRCRRRRSPWRSSSSPSTWALVRMRPRRSTRNPEPSRPPAPCSPLVTFTTAGELRATTACTLAGRGRAPRRPAPPPAAAGRRAAARCRARSPWSCRRRGCRSARRRPGPPPRRRRRAPATRRASAAGAAAAASRGGSNGFDPWGPYAGTGPG